MNGILRSPPQGIIFDLDGTLLDTEPLYSDAIQKVLDPFGHRYTLELKKKCMGGDSRVSAQLTIDEYNLPMTVDDYLATREIFLRELFPDSPEIPGAGEFVNRLSEHRIPLGLATSSHQHLCDLKLQHRPWRTAFKSIVCGDSKLVRRGKPAPDIFLACASEIDIRPEHCIVFEDSPTGIRAARAAGMKVLAVDSPWVEPEDLRDADLVLENYHQLLSQIDHWWL